MSEQETASTALHLADRAFQSAVSRALGSQADMGRLATVEELDLRGASNFADLRHFPKLKRLRVFASNLYDLSQLLVRPHLELEELHIGACPLRSLRGLQHLPSLRVLRTRGTLLTSDRLPPRSPILSELVLEGGVPGYHSLELPRAWSRASLPPLAASTGANGSARVNQRFPGAALIEGRAELLCRPGLAQIAPSEQADLAHVRRPNPYGKSYLDAPDVDAALREHWSDLNYWGEAPPRTAEAFFATSCFPSGTRVAALASAELGAQSNTREDHLTRAFFDRFPGCPLIPADPADVARIAGVARLPGWLERFVRLVGWVGWQTGTTVHMKGSFHIGYSNTVTSEPLPLRVSGATILVVAYDVHSANSVLYVNPHGSDPAVRSFRHEHVAGGNVAYSDTSPAYRSLGAMVETIRRVECGVGTLSPRRRRRPSPPTPQPQESPRGDVRSASSMRNNLRTAST